MFRTLDTLFRGAAAEREEALRDRFSVRLLDQKIRDAEAGLRAAKQTLAGLISRQRLEDRQLATIDGRIADLTVRARAAMDAAAEDMVRTAATAIADLENERTARARTKATLDARADRLRLSLERAHRRIADLRQAAQTAKAIDLERRGQRAVLRDMTGLSDVAEAEALVARIMGQEDPFETDEILGEIDEGLTGHGAEDRLAAAGFGPRTRISADDVMARLQTGTADKD